ncbi:MAG: coenzyme F420-0:L-glutamate ligase [Dehalococcoidia bacterium]|nr:coenzyme F420-0:L-glutamate ligase [Dehalococcoidia bacterium]
MNSNAITILPIEGIPEVNQGDNLGKLLLKAVSMKDLSLESGDIIVVTQKIVSKSEGQVICLADVKPSVLACEIAREHYRDPRHIEVVLRESKRIVRMERGVIISETRHGFTCANAGVDSSNSSITDSVCLLPADSDLSALFIREHIQKATGSDIAVIISDTFGRPWREGAVNVAIGLSGIGAHRDYRDKVDPIGYRLRTTSIAIVDELASAAELVMNKLDRVPAAVIRGYVYPKDNKGIKPLIRPHDKDLFG